MDKNIYSGNSKTSPIKIGSQYLFKKTFAKTRPYFFYKEIFINNYLRSIANNISAKPIKIDRVNKIIYYPLFESAKLEKINSLSYLNLIKKIHKHNNLYENKCPLYADQALENTKSISKHIFDRSSRLLYFSFKYPKEFKVHIKKIISCSEKAQKAIINHNLKTPLLFNHADSGLHNCILDKSGNLLLSDLEHAGLDSPIKQFLDYTLHPRNQHKHNALSEWVLYFKELIHDDDLKVLKFYSSLITLKWSLITLNEYLPHNWSIRIHSNPKRAEFKDAILDLQFKKSVIFLNSAFKQLDNYELINIFKKSEKSILSMSY